MEDFKYCSDSSSGELKNGKEKEDRGRGEEKKKRLRIDQVRELEKVYERDTKLDQERKIKLAKELGIQPRQVAIWFQNHRARWKTKRLEKDFLLLKSNYESLQLDYSHIQRQKQLLLTELRGLKEKLGEEEENYSIEKPSITENQNQQLIDQNNSTINRYPSSDHHPPLTMATYDQGLSWQQQFLSIKEEEEEEEEDHLQKYFLSTGEDESCNMMMKMKMMMPLPTDDQIPLFWYFSDMTN